MIRELVGEKWFLPLIFFIFYLHYIIPSLQIAKKRSEKIREYKKKRRLKLEITEEEKPSYLHETESTSHSERAYRAFELFFTITIALVGAIGYLKIFVVENANFAVVQRNVAEEIISVLAVFQWVFCSFVIIAVTTHLGSKWERWETISLDECWRWVECWMMIFAYIITEALWVYTRSWFS